MEVLGANYPTLKRQDRMPNGRVADMVFVEASRITVVEIKKDTLKVRDDIDTGEDVVDQIEGYIQQCRAKYPNRRQYRGIIIGTGIRSPNRLFQGISRQNIRPMVFGRDIPSVIKFCRCGRGLDYDAMSCRCGVECR